MHWDIFRGKVKCYCIAYNVTKRFLYCTFTLFSIAYLSVQENNSLKHKEVYSFPKQRKKEIKKIWFLIIKQHDWLKNTEKFVCIGNI